MMWRFVPLPKGALGTLHELIIDAQRWNHAKKKIMQ